MRRRPLALAVIAVAVVALSFVAARSAETSRAEDGGGLGRGEEVLVQRDGDMVRVMRVTFAPGFGGDTDAVADGIAEERGFDANDAGLASSFAVLAKWKAEAIPVGLFYNPHADPTQVNPATRQTEPVSLLASIGRAIGTWNSVPDQSFRFEYLGTTSADTTACSDEEDSVNVIRFHSALPPGVLGVTCSVGVLESDTVLLLEFDMEITTVGVFWSVVLPTPEFGFDLDTTVLHELGHALGLDHSANPDAVMFARATGGESRRRLTADDIAGLRSLYGRAAAPSPTPSPPSGPGLPAGPGPSPGASLVITPNSAYSPGLNGIVVQGNGPASAVAAKIASVSGRPVEALWMLVGGKWLFFLPADAGVGGLAQFPGPFAGAIVVLS